MTADPDLLHKLLPAVYRVRDADRGEPLRQFLELLTDPVAVVDENLAQLYDDLFVETAAPWALPYLAELIGLRGLPGADRVGSTARAEVANTIGYRRRKGTAAVLEQLARDVTRWPARAVEFFELLVATQYVNHVRPQNQGTVDVRAADRLAFVGTPFERLEGETDLTHTLDVRRIASRRGRYNIPHVGIFLWRLRPYPQTRSPAVPAELGEARRFLLSPLGRNTQLCTLPTTEEEIAHLATPANVPDPSGRRPLARDVAAEVAGRADGIYYGSDRSVRIERPNPGGDPVPVDVAEILVCDLRDAPAGGWVHTPPPPGRVALDPVLGRVAFPDDQAAPPLATFHHAFSADVGGGEYDRVGSFGVVDGPTVPVSNLRPGVPAATIAAGVAGLGGASGTVEIVDGGRYAETPALVADGRQLELRAADKQRPTLVLDGELTITGDEDGELTLNGLLILGGPLRVTGLRRLRLRHCTLVPGISLTIDGQPAQPGAASLVVESAATVVEIDACILGGLRVDRDAEVVVRNSIVDAGATGVAYASDTALDAAGGRLTLTNCTVLGTVHALAIELASNTIFLADPPAGRPPVLAERRQEGCVRFSYLPAGARTPRRHRCQPARDGDAARLRPVLTSTRYGDPGYCQLDRRTPAEVRTGADDESEMGVFHDLFQPQREDYLVRRLNEYLRFGLEAGIFFAS